MIQVLDARGCSVLHPFVLQLQRCASSVAIALLPVQVAESSHCPPPLLIYHRAPVCQQRPRDTKDFIHSSQQLVVAGATVPSVRLVRLCSVLHYSTATAGRGAGGGGSESSFISHHYAPGELGAAGRGDGEPLGAGDEPGADGRRLGQGAGDRAAAGGDDGDAARPSRVRVRALAHRPRREGQRREEGAGAGARWAVGARRVGGAAGSSSSAAAADGGGAREAGAETAPARERGQQLPQQQRRRAPQLLHAAVPHPELHRAAAQPDAVRLRQRRLRLQQQGEGRGRRHRQVLVVTVGSPVAQVQPAGPGRAAQGQRPHRDPQSRQTLAFVIAKSLKLSMLSCGVVLTVLFFLLGLVCYMLLLLHHYISVNMLPTVTC